MIVQSLRVEEFTVLDRIAKRKYNRKSLTPEQFINNIYNNPNL